MIDSIFILYYNVTMIDLTRNQINALHELMKEYSESESVKVTCNRSSGIGVNVYATVRYTANREHTIDITDYASW